jgi:L-fuculose-phosphate aldolase
MTAKQEIEQQLKQKVVDACWILYVEGHGDRTLGHVSARIPGQQAMYMKPNGQGLEEVEPEDIITVDFDGVKLAGDRPRHGEWPLHTEVYRARPEIQCVIHTHPPYTVWLSTLNKPMAPVNQDAVFFWQALPNFEETPDLIVDAEQGRRVADMMGSLPVLLMRNHGVLVGGESVEEATMLALHLEKAAQAYWIALSAGQPCSAIGPEFATGMAAGFLKNKPRLADIFQYQKRKAYRSLGKLTASAGRPG